MSATSVILLVGLLPTPLQIIRCLLPNCLYNLNLETMKVIASDAELLLLLLFQMQNHKNPLTQFPGSEMNAFPPHTTLQYVRGGVVVATTF